MRILFDNHKIFNFSYYSQLSYCFYNMAPSAQGDSSNMTNDPWSQQNGKETTESNHRPPVFFPEDYIAALNKFNNFARSENESIYDLTPASDPGNINVSSSATSNKSRTLPLSKHSEYKWVWCSRDFYVNLSSYVRYFFFFLCKLTNFFIYISSNRINFLRVQEPYRASWCWNDVEAIRFNHWTTYKIEGRLEAIISKVNYFFILFHSMEKKIQNSFVRIQREVNNFSTSIENFLSYFSCWRRWFVFGFEWTFISFFLNLFNFFSFVCCLSVIMIKWRLWNCKSFIMFFLSTKCESIKKVQFELSSSRLFSSLPQWFMMLGHHYHELSSSQHQNWDLS